MNYFGELRSNKGDLVRGRRLGRPGAQRPDPGEVFKSILKINEKFTIFRKIPMLDNFYRKCFHLFKKLKSLSNFSRKSGKNLEICISKGLAVEPPSEHSEFIKNLGQDSMAIFENVNGNFAMCSKDFHNFVVLFCKNLEKTLEIFRNMNLEFIKNLLNKIKEACNFFEYFHELRDKFLISFFFFGAKPIKI